MRLNQSTLALVLGSFSIAQAAVYDRNGRLERRQESAQPTGVNIASGLMGIVNRVLASATVTETVRQTITVGGDGAAGAIANATVTVTIAETTITVSAGQAGGDAAASTAPGNANGVIESGGASPTQSEVAATGGVGVVVIEVPEEARKTSLVAPEVPATSEAVVVPPTDGASTDLAIPTGAASSTDAATPTDAASATDSVSTDLATPTDAASSTDAATPTDAASATDSVSTDLATPTDAATSTDALASPTLLTPPGVATDAPAESSLLPLPGLESSSLAVLPILESSTEESAPASTTAADATASTSVPAEAVTTTEAASATSLAPLPGIASSLDSTLNLGGAGGAAQPTVLPSPDGAFGGVAGAIPIASAEVPPPPLPTATPGVANGADAGNTGNGGQVQIDLSGVELSRTLNLGNLVQARQTAVPAAAGAI